MAFCDVKNPPEFTVEIRKWDRETLADGQEMAVVIEQLMNNTVYNKVIHEQDEQNRKQRKVPITVNLLASGWSTTAPYSQNVVVPGIKETDHPVLGLCTPKGLTPTEIKIRKKMTGMITDGDAEDGSFTFYCGEKKPSEDFAVYLIGVSTSG